MSNFWSSYKTFPFTIVSFTFCLLPLYTRFFTILFSGCMFGWFRSIMTRSAFLPTARLSQSNNCMACAPPVVAIYKISSALTHSASISRTFASAEVKNISRNISKQLLLAGPSVPIAMEIPSSTKRLVGQIPEASFKLEAGFVTAVSFFFL